MLYDELEKNGLQMYRSLKRKHRQRQRRDRTGRCGALYICVKATAREMTGADVVFPSPWRLLRSQRICRSSAPARYYCCATAAAVLPVLRESAPNRD